MKFIFIFLFLSNFTFHWNTQNTQKDPPPEFAYQLKDQKIIKQMSEPIIITNQGENLLDKNSYLTQTQLVLPSEDLDYIRSNKIDVNLRFNFHFEWWNPMQHHALPEPLPQVYQSLKAEDIIERPRHLVSRLIWKSNIINDNRQFSHMILFYYDDNFNLIMAHQLQTDLADWEIKAIANEPKGAPKNYRISLEDLTIVYPLPTIFNRLQTSFLEMPKLFSRHERVDFWNELMRIFLNDWLTVEDNFEEFFVAPIDFDEAKMEWQQPGRNAPKYLNLSLEYRSYYYLKIYQYFFPFPKLKIIYYQYLDLNLEFDNTTLSVKKNQNYWEAFKLEHQTWQWYLNNDVEITSTQNSLLLKSKKGVWVKGVAKINIIIYEISLSDLPLIVDFEFLQFNSKQILEKVIFDYFKKYNPDFFSQEMFENYSIMRTNQKNQFILKAHQNALFSGEIKLNFGEINEANSSKDFEIKVVSKPITIKLVLSLIFLAIIICSSLVLAFLKFTKSKPPRK